MRLIAKYSGSIFKEINLCSSTDNQVKILIKIQELKKIEVKTAQTVQKIYRAAQNEFLVQNVPESLITAE